MVSLQAAPERVIPPHMPQRRHHHRRPQPHRQNGGHSAAAALVAGYEVVSFDLGVQSYTKSVERMLHLAFGDRFTLVLGDSSKTIPQLQESLRGRCDVIMVDGAHTHGSF